MNQQFQLKLTKVKKKKKTQKNLKS
jgi:hypothetical protein